MAFSKNAYYNVLFWNTNCLNRKAKCQYSDNTCVAGYLPIGSLLKIFIENRVIHPAFVQVHLPKKIPTVLFWSKAMSQVKSLLIATVATISVALASSCVAQGQNSITSKVQGCTECQGQATTGGIYQSAFGGCNNAGCGCLGGGQFIEEMKARHAHTKMLHARIQARNDAWPKPFNCADRQVYFSVWGPMIDKGFEERSVLTSMHFDKETNKLNRMGQFAVAGIMQNMPQARKTVFINRDVDAQINDARLAQVQDTIRTFYGQSTSARVAFSSRLPVTTSGVKADLTQQAWLGALAVPMIPVSVGEDVEAAVGN